MKNDQPSLMERMKGAETRLHSWGPTVVLYRDDFVEVRLLLLGPDKATSLHAHKIRAELQIPLDGIVPIVDSRGTQIELTEGRRAYFIPPGCFHQFATLPGQPGQVLSLAFGRVESDRV